MRVQYVLGSLLGGVVIFVACASEKGAETAFDGGILDAVVADAKAEPPQVDDVKCTVRVDDTYFAEKSYPGRTLLELSRATALNCNSVDGSPPGYSCRTLPSVWAKDGFLAAYCADGAGATVRFIVPAP